MKEIKVGQVLYYHGLGYGFKTYCFKIVLKEGVRFVHANDGTIRKEEDVINNTCNLYSSKEEINKKLAGSWKSKMMV